MGLSAFGGGLAQATKIGLLDRLRVLLTGNAPSAQKYDQTARAWTTPYQNQPHWTPVDYAALAREGYQTNVYVYRAVKIIAQSIGSLRWIAVRRKAGGEVEEIPNHPVLDLLRRPNPRQGQSRFFEAVEAHLILQGNAYVQASGPTSGENRGKPSELYTMRPDRVKVIVGDQINPVKGYQYIAYTEPIVLPAEQVMHLRNFHPLSDFYGMAALEPGARSVDTNNEGRTWNMKLLENSARPPGMFASEQPLNDIQYQRVRQQIEERYAGAANAGTPMISDGSPVKWVPFGYTPAEMDWLNGLKMTAEEIGLAVGCPPELLGASIKRFATYAEARKSLYHETILPEADYLRDELNTWLMPKFGDVELDYDRDGIEAIREDRAQVWSMAGEAWKDGRLTKNEARVAMGYDEEPDADYFVLPMTLTREDDPAAAADIPTEDGGGDPSGNAPVDDGADNADPQQQKPPAKGWEFKVFRLNSPKKRARHFKSLERRRQAWRKSIRTAARKRLNAQRQAIVSAVRDARDPSLVTHAAEAAISGQRVLWEKFYRSVYMTVGADFRDAVYRGLKADLASDWTLTGPKESKAKAAIVRFLKSDEDATAMWNDQIASWLDANAGQKITGILNTDLERVRNQLAEGTKAGEGADELAARIDEYLDPIYANRAETVARTEVVPASNLGSQIAALSTDLPLVKSWLATSDDRTRDDHLSADGQTVDISAPYEVGGSRLMFAGDSSLGADASETINCRCSETYDLKPEAA